MSIIDDVKDRLSLLAAMRRTGGAELEETEDGNARGWHTEHDSQSKNSLHIYDHGQKFKCFGCGMQGDLIDWFGYRLYGTTYDSHDRVQAVDALREAATCAGLNGVKLDGADDQRRIQNILGDIAVYYHQQLSDEWRQFYRTHYGFTDATIDTQQLGFAPPDGDALWKYLRKVLKLTLEETLSTGLVTRGPSGTLFDLFQGRLVFPYWRRGVVVYFAARQTDDTPQWTDKQGQRVEDTRKYVKQMVHGKRHAHVSPHIQNSYFHSEDVIAGANTLFVTEGIADCILANQEGFPTISPVTVRVKRKSWPRLLQLVAHAKQIYLVNDNENSGVGEEGSLATAAELWRHGHVAHLIDLPRADGVSKVDLNDFLRDAGPDAFRLQLPRARTLLDIYIDDDNALGNVFTLLAQVRDVSKHILWRRELPARLKLTKGEYDQLLKAALAAYTPPVETVGEQPRYKVVHGCICELSIRTDQDGNESVSYTPLCQFSARIVAEVIKDDGEQVTRHLRITGATADGEVLDELELASGKFEDMRWPVEFWGASAAIEPGRGIRDKLRHAIQWLSDDAVTEHVYTHTGWREIDGKRCFLTARGAIGLEHVKVELPQHLQRYALPIDPVIDLTGAVRSSIGFLSCAEPHISYPLWACLYLAPLTEILLPAFVLWIEGASGIGKSTLASVALCHFGDFDEFHLPEDWLSTPNALERSLFVAKDVPLIIDDYRPSSDSSEQREMQKSAARIIRSAGNRSARNRLTRDTEFRRVFHPRGLLIATAEQDALGHSLNARVLTLAALLDDIPRDGLSQAQAAKGQYAVAMAGYLGWLADHWSQLSTSLPQRLAEMLRSGDEEQHRRLPNTQATLATAFDVAMQFAIEVGAIGQKEAGCHLSTFQTVMDELSAQQNEHVAEEEPAHVFLRILVSSLRARKLCIEGGPNVDDIGGDHEKATIIGWHDRAYVYLLPSAYTAAHQHALQERWTFPVTARALNRSMHQAGLLADTDRRGSRTQKVKQGLDGTNKRVLMMYLDTLLAYADAMGLAKGSLWHPKPSADD